MDHHSTAPLDKLVAAVVGLGGPLTSIVSAMREWQAAGHSARDAPPIPDVLTTLLTAALADLGKDTQAMDLRTTARVLERVTDLIAAEFYVVDPSLLDVADTA